MSNEEIKKRKNRISLKKGEENSDWRKKGVTGGEMLDSNTLSVIAPRLFYGRGETSLHCKYPSLSPGYSFSPLKALLIESVSSLQWTVYNSVLFIAVTFLSSRGAQQFYSVTFLR